MQGEPWGAKEIGVFWNGAQTVAHVPAQWQGVLSDDTPGGVPDRTALVAPKVRDVRDEQGEA